MIFGFVHNREAIIQLAIVGDQQKKQGIRAVIDTGFTGGLTLPLTMIVAEHLMSIVGQSSGTVSFG